MMHDNENIPKQSIFVKSLLSEVFIMQYLVIFTNHGTHNNTKVI